MQEIEAKISDLLRSCIKGENPVGRIECDGHDGGCGFTGGIESGLLHRKMHDLSEIFDAAERDDLRSLHDESAREERKVLSFTRLLRELRTASQSQPLGPWYRCNIEFRPEGQIAFHYFWEKTPFANVKELPVNIHGGVPDFIFKHRFDRALVEGLADSDVDDGLLTFVLNRFEAHKAVSDPLLELFATWEWESDVNNGAMNQYFARDYEPMSGLPRSELYDKCYCGLQRIEHDGYAAIFAESIALYAHFYPRVEQVRQKMGILAVPRQDQSDIMSRYYELDEPMFALRSARVAYIREHIDEIEQA